MNNRVKNILGLMGAGKQEAYSDLGITGKDVSEEEMERAIERGSSACVRTGSMAEYKRILRKAKAAAKAGGKVLGRDSQLLWALPVHEIQKVIPIVLPIYLSYFMQEWVCRESEKYAKEKGENVSHEDITDAVTDEQGYGGGIVNHILRYVSVSLDKHQELLERVSLRSAGAYRLRFRGSVFVVGLFPEGGEDMPPCLNIITIEEFNAIMKGEPSADELAIH